MATEESDITIGKTVYDEDGEPLGEIRGLTADGFAVTTREGIDALSIEHQHPDHGFGEAELLWRCADCGELGEVEDIPDECPSCGAPRTALYYWIED